MALLCSPIIIVGSLADEHVLAVQAGLIELGHEPWIGVPMFNPPRAQKNITKPYQISLLAEAGLPVPETLWSNDPAAVRAFCAHKERIYKPVTGGAATQKVSREDLSDEQGHPSLSRNGYPEMIFVSISLINRLCVVYVSSATQLTFGKMNNISKSLNYLQRFNASVLLQST